VTKTQFNLQNRETSAQEKMEKFTNLHLLIIKRKLVNSKSKGNPPGKEINL